jgi:hypothetical protein
MQNEGSAGPNRGRDISTRGIRGNLLRSGGAEEIRTPDPHNAIVVLYQLSYDPTRSEAETLEIQANLSKVIRSKILQPRNSLPGATRQETSRCLRWPEETMPHADCNGSATSTPNGPNAPGAFATLCMNAGAPQVIGAVTPPPGVPGVLESTGAPFEKLLPADRRSLVDALLRSGETLSTTAMLVRRADDDRLRRFVIFAAPTKGPAAVEWMVAVVEAPGADPFSYTNPCRDGWMEAVKSVCGRVAHDFNNILQPVLGETSLLRLVGGLSTEVDAAMQSVESTARKGMALTTDLQRFAAGKPGETIMTDLAAAVREWAPLLQRLTGPKIRLSVESEPIPAKAPLDRESLKRVLVQTVLEAANHHVESSEITIWVGPGQKPADGASSSAVCRVSRRPAAAATPSDRNHLDRTPWDEAESLGLELAWAFAHWHGGSAATEQKPGGESDLIIRLPWPPPPSPPPV